ncbi:AraC family transcriptional regulator [Solimonas sp. SE-A11]|uniref:AraC family transcriptional regulator n=1 Tax=Solimonas sp. SE-A11 TaxID=3054954 RepID=UPI00259CC745|nr:AraC family transcriptional regulator [Solimonas sp. SE-A11]MDM4769777.1 AraC family transcriptional regulator [Solimonas sp. SE-A11]
MDLSRLKLPPDINQPSIPVSYLQLLVEIMAERGVEQDQLLAGVPMAPELLAQPEARMSAYQWTLLAMNGIRLSGDPGLGYEYGLRMRPTSHGFLGYATMSCDSMRQAMDVTIRYVQARQRNFTMSLSTDATHGTITLREKHPIPVLRSFFVENILLGLARGACAILGMELRDFQGAEIGFDWPEPPYHAAYRERLPNIRFGQPANLLRFPLRYLELRPVLADPHASRQAIELCERELAQAGGLQDSVGLRVCAELRLSHNGGYPSVDAVAERMHMSGRSLKRKLQAEGTSYLALLEDVRQRDAQELLRHSTLELQQVAARLGYTNPANFTRAFRKWTGDSPSGYRRRLLDGNSG